MNMIKRLYSTALVAVNLPVYHCSAPYLDQILGVIFGFVPMGAKSSFGVYCTYFSPLFDMIFDENTYQPVKATNQDKLNSLIALVKAATSMIIGLSVLSPHGNKVFGETNAGEFYEGNTLRDYLDARHLGNSFVIACEL